MNDCIFCKIVAGEVPSTKVYEDDTVLGFLNIDPKGPKHTLLVPKTHYRWFWELPDEISDKLFRAAKKVAQQLKDETGMDFVRLSIVGEEVPHVHVHLIPQNF